MCNTMSKNRCHEEEKVNLGNVISIMDLLRLVKQELKLKQKRLVTKIK